MTFWDVQVNAIKCLDRLGIKVTMRDRIEIFKMWLKLNRLALDLSIDPTTINDAKDALNGLMYFRNCGLEPAHSKGLYVTK